MFFYDRDSYQYFVKGVDIQFTVLLGAEAMDLRYYSNKIYIGTVYEGFDKLGTTPFGIANTSEAYVQFYIYPPTNEELFERANE